MDLGALIQILFAGSMLVIGFVVGEILERRHYKSIRARELRWRRMPAITLGYIPVPEGWDYEKAGLVTGHVVISVDHFKRFVAGLRQIFGGRIRAYETLMDRARREAVLRLKQRAINEGYHAVVNMRLESVRLASARRKGKGTAGIEVLAFGTGIRLGRTAA